MGAGFRIAALDLELRGAGNLLGGEQHGHIEAIGFDFAIAEECQAYDECERYTRAYGNQVYELEYADTGGRETFDAACAARGARISITYRDRNLVPRGHRGFVVDFC